MPRGGKPPEPLPNVFLQVNDETKTFELWLETTDETEAVANGSFTLHANCENWLTSAKYVVLAVNDLLLHSLGTSITLARAN